VARREGQVSCATGCSDRLSAARRLPLAYPSRRRGVAAVCAVLLLRLHLLRCCCVPRIAASVWRAAAERSAQQAQAPQLCLAVADVPAQVPWTRTRGGDGRLHAPVRSSRRLRIRQRRSGAAQRSASGGMPCVIRPCSENEYSAATTAETGCGRARARGPRCPHRPHVRNRQGPSDGGALTERGSERAHREGHSPQRPRRAGGHLW